MSETTDRGDFTPEFVLTFGRHRRSGGISAVVDEATYQAWYRRVFDLADDCTHPIDEHWWMSHVRLDGGHTTSVTGEVNWP